MWVMVHNYMIFECDERWKRSWNGDTEEIWIRKVKVSSLKRFSGLLVLVNYEKIEIQDKNRQEDVQDHFIYEFSAF